MSSFVGHEKICHELVGLRERDKVPTALFFSGPRGLGKRLVADAFAEYMLCDSAGDSLSGCRGCASCKLIEAGNHPDLIVIDCEKELWRASEARDFVTTLSRKPFRGTGRVVIVDHAECISIEAANILLKPVEEPSSDTRFVFVSAAPSRVPVTIRSRCQFFSFYALTQPELLSWIQSLVPDDEINKEEVCFVAQGSPGTAWYLLHNFSEWLAVKNLLRAVVKGKSDDVFDFLKQTSKERDLMRRQIQMMVFYCSSAIRTVKTDTARRRWALFMNDLFDVEYLVYSRHIAPEQVLLPAILRLTAPVHSFEQPRPLETLLR